jgi:poly(3-hydroxybutyrate) depolymerase
MNDSARVCASAARRGRLMFCPEPPRDVEAEPGLRSLREQASGVRADLYVPPARSASLRLVVVLHGAGGRPEQALRLLQPFADDHQLVLLAPASVGRTWDVVTGGLGPDVRVLDGLLEEVSELCPVAARSVGGFSDGASYALSLAVANGDVFDAAVAFSPGFVVSHVVHGSPRLFVSHGVRDAVLPIDACSRRLVPDLRRGGYDVTYREFPGGHEVPDEVAHEAVSWLTGDPCGTAPLG